MNQRFPKLLVVVAIVAIAIVVIVFVAIRLRSTATTQHDAEHFENKIDKGFLSTIYQNKGVDRCETLFADPVARGDMRLQMSEKALQSMDNFILGYRLREWQPDDKAQRESLNKTSKYCYFMYDSNNQAIDALLKDGTCDMRNPLFQDIPFVNRVFEDNKNDTTHTLPYNKCVIDINPENVNTTSLNSFWARMGAAQCTNYHSMAANQVNTLVRDVTKCNNEFKGFQSTEPKFTQCMTHQSNLTAELDMSIYNYNMSNCAFNGNCSNLPEGSRPRMTNNIDKLRKAISETQNGLNQTNQAILQTQKQLKSEERQLNEMKLSLSSLSNDYVRCIATDLPEAQTQLIETREEFKRLTDTCNLLAQQYVICKNTLQQKKQEYEAMIVLTNRTKGLYDGSNSQYVTCLSTNDQLRNEISALKDQYQKLATQCNDCTSKLVLRLAERDALSNDVMNLTAERDEWLARCKYDQKTMIDQSIETINQLRVSATQYTRTNCGNDMQEAEAVNDLIKQKFAALGMGNQPINCGANETQRRNCCAARGLE